MLKLAAESKIIRDILPFTMRNAWTAIPGLQKVKPRSEETPDPRERCICAPVFKRIKSKSAHTS
jgi:hypothetical protein